MTEIDDSLTAMDWLVNPAIDIFSGLKINAFLFDQVSQPEKRDYLSVNIKSEPTHSDKPPYSYAELIKKAIESSPQRKMTLNEIYEWICKNFPYYREGQNGWKVFPSKTAKCKPPILRNSPMQLKASTSEPSGSMLGSLCNRSFEIVPNFGGPFSEEQLGDKLVRHFFPFLSRGLSVDMESHVVNAHFLGKAIMETRATSEAAQSRKLNSTFRQLVDSLFPRPTANFDTSSNFPAQSTDPETDLLKSRLHTNLWIASFFDWSAVDQSGIGATTGLLSRLERLTTEPSTTELLSLNECLENIFNGKPSTTVDFDSSSSSPQILPGIQDSFGPCAPKDLDVMDDPAAKDGDLYGRPISWVQSILQHEDDHPKDEETVYQRRVTSYFEPISLDGMLQLPPINDLQRREEFRSTRVIPPPLYHSDMDLVSTESVGYGASWSTPAQRNTFSWEAIH
ncbi:unnamed protein product [Taenia asiatica]|uniref:Fork-head domain-containing protein n=1 Tax=Taenia asiatica TaxID=60517 RepID=A0A158R6Y0_TAEAS|nr:unnamed protein product [Taenia asiatica]